MSKSSHGVTLKRSVSQSGAYIVACIAIFVIWQIVALSMQEQGGNASKVFPTLQYIFTEGLADLDRYCSFDIEGWSESALGALALVENGLITVLRVLASYVVALVCALVAGLHLSQHPLVQEAISGPINLTRVLPAFAMAPLFILWFGATSTAAFIFIVFSVFFMVLIAELDAIKGIDPAVVEYAQTMGASKMRLLYKVLLPASIVRIRGTVTFSGLVAWTSVLSAEMNGLQDGLGYIVSDNIRFSNIADMFLGALVFCLLSFLTMRALEHLVDRITVWRS